tara:strand:+ start:1216 stop:3468 length:2253 start_codon:yes stop_codon:yes gene_type:complete
LAIGLVKAEGYRNFNLTCLAPLLEQVDSDIPATLEVAFLRGPTRAPVLRNDLGTVDFPLSTTSTDAQAFFNQGTALLHGLNFREAERNFRQALAYDSGHPMIFWGLAMANEQRPGRARLFAHHAIRRISNETTDRERLWIGALARFFDVHTNDPDKLPPPPVLDDEQSRERIRHRIRDLEDLVLSAPDDVEAKAFLLRQLTLDKYRAGIPITSHVAVDTLAKAIAETAPEHPSRHYQIFLWLEERPAMSLLPAKESPTLAPGISDSWRYAAEAWRANGLHHNAVPVLEAALRVDHSQLQDHLLMPTEIDNLSSNYAALVETLSSMGRVEEAIQWAQRMIALPRDLEPLAKSQESINAQGRRLWVETRLGAEMAEALLEELESDPRLRPQDKSALVQARCLYWKAVALNSLQRFEEIDSLEKQIANVSERAESASSQKAISSLLEGLTTWNALHTKDQEVDPKAVPPNVPSWIWAKELVRAGHPESGLELARQTWAERPGQWLPAASFCELSYAAGEIVPAMTAFNRRFRIDAARVDRELPLLKKLDALAGHMKLPGRWTIASSKEETLGIPADPDALGPRFWEPAKAPSFSLPDHSGREISLESLSGDAVLVHFILGVACPYCTKQLDAFRPYVGAYAKAGIKTVLITTDSVEVLTGFFGKEPEKTPEMRERYPYPVLTDPTLDVFRSYGVHDDFEEGGMHGTILIDPKGRILWKHVGHSTFEEPRLLLNEAQRLLLSQDPSISSGPAPR